MYFMHVCCSSNGDGIGVSDMRFSLFARYMWNAFEKNPSSHFFRQEIDALNNLSKQHA